jgi:cell division septal protein FtsQ
MKRRNFLKCQNINKNGYKYKNPYFTNNKNSNRKLYIFLPIAVFLIILIIWGVIMLPFMHISTIEINGLITTQPKSVESSVNTQLLQPVLKLIPGNHIWFLNKNKIAEKLEEEFQLTNITIQRDGRKLIINTDELITRAVWVSNNQMSFLDKNGYIVRQLTNDERNEVEIQINTQTSPNIFLQSFIIPIWDLSGTTDASVNVLSSSALNAVIQIDELFRKSNITPIAYQIEKQNQDWLIVKTTLAVDIYFDGAGNAQEQFNNLQIILSEYKNNVQSLDYIDLRFGNRVYIK